MVKYYHFIYYLSTFTIAISELFNQVSVLFLLIFTRNETFSGYFFFWSLAYLGNIIIKGDTFQRLP